MALSIGPGSWMRNVLIDLRGFSMADDMREMKVGGQEVLWCCRHSFDPTMIDWFDTTRNEVGSASFVDATFLAS